MKRLLGDIRRADEDFHMIARGDRVAVGVSGGKDSLVLLRALAVYSRFAVKPFEVVAITLKTGDPFDVAPIRALCEELNVPYVVEECDLIHQLFDVRREENPCALCARLRRGALLRMADALGIGRKDIGRDQLSAVLSLAQKGGTAARQISLPRGATVRMADGFLTMHLSPAAPEKAALTEGVPLHWGNFELTLLRRADGEGISLRALENSEAIFVAPCDLNAHLTLEGANGARSVKRLCVDKKITPPERDALPAIYAGDRLAAVWRLGTDVSFLPQSEEDARFVRIVPL